MRNVYLSVHGHFYQPPRQDPFTELLEREQDAAPYHDFNEKIWDECYHPNAAAGNFGRLSFDLGPTLADWLEQAHPDTLRTIADAARGARAAGGAGGHGNVLAHPYHHIILPLATRREKQLQVAWGLRDFRRRFGYAPSGMWLPETAADDETLDVLAAHGVTFTLLAPWQSAAPDPDTREPYRVELPSGRALTVLFYDAALSGDVSFNDETTADAARFCTRDLAARVDAQRAARGVPQLLLIATDGELYGHHKRFRELFLRRLLAAEAPARGFTVVTPEAYLALAPPARTTRIRPGTSWSCAHGVARWDRGCACTPGDSSWKRPLRLALRHLATRLDAVYESETAGVLRDPWRALERYLELRDGSTSPAAFWAAHAPAGGGRTLCAADEERLRGLLEMQFARHAMFVSCAWFIADLDRREPRIALAQAAYAVALAHRHAGADLAPALLADLGLSLSLHTGRTAADLYHEVAGRLT